jgi:glyoxylase-like metal-dependent hydrolase (beta-lactamase superfamily II)
MIELANGVYLLGGPLRYVINVYLVGDILIDSGTRYSGHCILRQLEGRTLRAHALTHAHPDHQGSSHLICVNRSIPLWCSERDRAAAEDSSEMLRLLSKHWLPRTFAPLMAGPSHQVSRRLREGDVVGDFEVIETPGHSAGHLSFWRKRDRTLILGDVLASMQPFTGWPGLREPPDFFSADPHQNRQSARKVAALEPSLVCFGHGPPLRNPQHFRRFVDTLPD